MGKKLMKPTPSDFRVGDCVKVKGGTQDPDLSADISDWQGRVQSPIPIAKGLSSTCAKE